MFRCRLAILLYFLALGAGAGAHPLLLTNFGTSFIGPRDNSGQFELKLLSYFKTSKGQDIHTTANIKIFSSQGYRSKMYQVLGNGWPCWACASQSKTCYGALAKNHIDPGFDSAAEFLKSVAHENEGLQRVGQLLDNGTRPGDTSYWTIVRDMRVISGSSKLRQSIHDFKKKSDTLQSCQKRYNEASDATLARMKWYVEVKGILHDDVHTGNVLFSSDLQDVELIDWGMWIDQAKWKPDKDPVKTAIEYMRKDFNHERDRHCAQLI